MKTQQIVKELVQQYRKPGTDECWFSTKAVAKIIRAVLKDRYPNTKFKIRSSSFAGGSAIDVCFNKELAGAPTVKEIDAIVHAYSTKGFDGMIDMQYCIDRWMLPNGTIAGSVCSGTESSRGTKEAINDPKPHPEAVLLTGGAGWVHVSGYMPE